MTSSPPSKANPIEEAIAKLTSTKGDKLLIYQLQKQMMIARARIDPAYFIEYVLTHEKTGRRIKNADFHKEWQEFFSECRWGVIIAPIEHGKSFQISVGRILWELGKNHDLRILLIGRTGPMAEKALRLIRQHIQYNRRLHEVFPSLKRGTRDGDLWTNSDIMVERSYYSKDPSVQARGMGSGSILGSRLDIIVFDDGLDLDNTKTKHMRDKAEDWWDTVVFSRLVDDYETKEFGRVFAIGTPFDNDDLLHRLAGRKGWRLAQYCAVENPDDPEDQWRPIWPAVWPLQRLLDRRAGMTLTAFARMLLCQVLDAATRRFKKAWIDHMKWLGRNRTFMRSPPTENGQPLPCFTGLDIGIGKKETDAVSCFFTLAVASNGRRIVADIDSGHWSGPEILNKCKEKSDWFNAEIMVESNAAQRFIAEFAVEYKGVFAVPVNTGKEKWDDEFGVESLAVLMKNGFLVCPSGTDGNETPEEAQAWCDECSNFDPASHTGDRLMASWIADKGVREYLQPRIEDESDHVYR